MLGLTYEDICAKIKEAKGFTDQELEFKVKEKIDKLSGLISKEGAVHIIANECGINLADELRRRGVKINRVMAGMKGVSLLGKVLRVYEVRSFSKQGREGKVGSFLIGDETGVIRIVLWDTQHLQYMEQGQLQEGMIVKIMNAMARQNQQNPQFLELHLGTMSQLILNPPGETVTVLERPIPAGPSLQKKKIHELQEGDTNVQLFGTIVQLFEPHFYDACSQCNKKVTQGQCAEHGTVISKPIPLLNFYFDDGTSNIRAVAFRDQVLQLVGIDEATLLPLRENISLFEPYKQQILGKQLLLTGRVTKNEMFQRMEFTVQRVEEPNPEQLAEDLVKEAPPAL